MVSPTTNGRSESALSLLQEEEAELQTELTQKTETFERETKSLKERLELVRNGIAGLTGELAPQAEEDPPKAGKKKQTRNTKPALSSHEVRGLSLKILKRGSLKTPALRKELSKEASSLGKSIYGIARSLKTALSDDRFVSEGSGDEALWSLKS